MSHLQSGPFLSTPTWLSETDMHITSSIIFQYVSLKPKYFLNIQVQCKEKNSLCAVSWIIVSIDTHVNICCCSVTQSRPTLCNPMDCSAPGLPVLHHLPELAQTHWVGDALQLSHPLLSPSSPAFNLSQNQDRFQ